MNCPRCERPMGLVRSNYVSPDDDEPTLLGSLQFGCRECDQQTRDRIRDAVIEKAKEKDQPKEKS